MYGFAFLVLFIFVHTIFISNETRPFKSNNSSLAISGNINRAKRFNQSQKELLEIISKMKEPHPTSRKEAAELALNTVYKKNQRKASEWKIIVPEIGNSSSKLSFFIQDCSAKGLKADDLQDCTYFNEMRERRTAIQHQCNLMKEDPVLARRLHTPINSERLFVSKYRKVVWCPVYKAASTSWISVLPTLSNYRPSQIKILKRRFIQQNELAMAVAKPLPPVHFQKYVSSNDPVKFLIVRHPFDRFLSAYRDKFENMNEHFHRIYGQNIVQRYRRAGMVRFGADFYNQNGTHNGCPLERSSCERGDGTTPTFWEFARAVIDGAIDVDEHWSPIYISCSICRLSFDVILHFENLQEEYPYLIRQLGLENLLPSNPWYNRNSVNLTLDMKQSYFKMLTQEEIQALYNFYKFDFDLFQYDLKSYLHFQY